MDCSTIQESEDNMESGSFVDENTGLECSEACENTSIENDSVAKLLRFSDVDTPTSSVKQDDKEKDNSPVPSLEISALSADCSGKEISFYELSNDSIIIDAMDSTREDILDLLKTYRGRTVYLEDKLKSCERDIRCELSDKHYRAITELEDKYKLQLQAEREAHDKRMDQRLCMYVDNERKKNQRLRDKIEELESSLTKNEIHENQRLRNQITELEGFLAKNKINEDQNQRLRDQITELEGFLAKNKVNEDQNQKLKARIEELEASLASFTASSVQKEKAHLNLNAELDQAKLCIAQLTTTVTATTTNSFGVQVDTAIQQSDVEKLELAIEGLTEELNNSRQRVLELTKQVRNYEMTLEEAAAEFSKKEEIIENLEKIKLEYLESQKMMQKVHAKQLLSAKKPARETLAALDSFEQHEEEFEVDERLKMENKVLNEKLKNLSEDLTDLEGRYVAKTDALKHEMSDNSVLKDKNADMEERIIRLEKEIGKLQAFGGDQAESVRNLEAELNLVNNRCHTERNKKIFL